MISDHDFLNALCRENLGAFTQKSFTLIEPTTPYMPNWHIDVIAEHLQAVWDGEIRNLIINMPPRSLKTHTTSVAFPAWGLGKDPSIQFMLTSFKASLAENMTRRTRSIMQNEWYKGCFPDTRLSEDLNRQYYFETTQRGQYFSSAMANVTGTGCSIQICFPAGTIVKTNNGDMKIEDVVACQSCIFILSHNDDIGKLEWKKLIGRSVLESNDFIEIITTKNKFECTPNHEIYINGKYVKAENIKVGQRLLSLPNVWGWYEQTSSWALVLLQRLQACGFDKVKAKVMSSMQEILSTKALSQTILQPEMCGSGPFIQNESHRKPKLQRGWGFLQQGVSKDKTTNSNERWKYLCSLWNCGSKRKDKTQDNPNEIKYSRSPHRRKSREQFIGKPSFIMRFLSCFSPQEDTVIMVKRLCKERQLVYDITVEDNHNFFANGVLVSNCDDPLSPDDALSDKVRESVIETIRGTLFSRFNDPREARFVLNMQRLHSADPTGELMKEQGWYHLKLPAEAKGRSYFYSIRGKSWELKENQFLFPERFTPEVLDKSRQLLGDYGYAGQYLQEPVPIGGGLINANWLQYYQQGSIKPKTMNVCILVDPAGGDDDEKHKKDKNSDWTAMMVVGLGTDNNYYLLDIVRDRLNPTDRINVLFALHRKWGEATGKSPKVGYEKYSMQSDLHYINQKMRQDSYNFPLVPLGGIKSKTARVSRLVPDMQNGRWYLPNSLIYIDGDSRKWDLIQEFLNVEIKTFPMSKFDDMLDALSRVYETDLGMVFPRPKVSMTSKAVAKVRAGGDDGWESF